MVQFNFSERTIKAKVVYYGPPQSGKTTNLEQIHRLTDPDGANRLISLNTAQDRTLFFDLLPFSLGSVSGYDFKIQLYTVPGQVQYNATRRVVLAGADAVVFVADGQKAMARENQTAFENMKVNLLANRLVPERVPLVLQYNKQDLDNLLSRAELDRALNFWGRQAFPAVAARGEGVLETFVAVVQEMLSAIAVKYNLKEKGLDPAAVPEVVSQAFEKLLRRAPAPPTPDSPPPAAPSRVVLVQPDSAEPAFTGQGGTDSNPVSDELLHRAIRSNVELAEALGQLLRDVSLGLRTIAAQAEGLAGVAAARGPGSVIAHEASRLLQLLQEVGRAVPRPATAGLSTTPPVAPSPPAAPPSSPAPASSAVPRMPPPAGSASSPARTPPPAAPRAAAAVAPPAATLDALLGEAAMAARGALATRGIRVESRIPQGAALPRCSPAALRSALGGFFAALAPVLAPASAIAVRAERKPVLLRGRDGAEIKRDFVMIALTHGASLSEADQQRILKGSDPGPFGDGLRLLREIGGFLRFAPLPGGALETRLFVPVG